MTVTVDSTQPSSIEIRIGRAHVEDARLEQRLLRRDRYLLINEMTYARLARARDQRLAQRVEGGGLRGRKRPQRNPLRPRRARREQSLGTVDRARQRTTCR